MIFVGFTQMSLLILLSSLNFSWHLNATHCFRKMGIATLLMRRNSHILWQ
jgi:hypothetical protein